MGNDRVHSMRWTADQWETIERLAEHYGLSVPDLLRWMVEKEVERVGPALPKRRPPSKLPPFRLDILRVLAAADTPMAPWHVLEALMAKPFKYKPGDGTPGNRISAALEALRRDGYVVRERGGYVIEDKGREAIGEK